MPFGELLRFVALAIRGQKLRSALTVLGIAIGIGAVVLLAAIGEGTRKGLAAQLSQFGSNLVAIMPGKSETLGLPGAFGAARRLTLEDAEVVRRVPGVLAVAPQSTGVARVTHEARGRDVYVYGMTHDAELVFDWGPAIGTFIPKGDPRQTPAVCVLGVKLRRELFGHDNPMGARIRIGDSRFTVVGIMEAKGTYLGFDLDDSIFVPIVRAMRVFNQNELHEIDFTVHNIHETDRVVAAVTAALVARHRGEEDFTIVTQEAMLEIVDDVLDVVTQGVLAIAAIAIFVGAVGILTITWVSVHERTAEIGLMKAIGASNGQVLSIFLAEATILSGVGGTIGVIGGVGCAFAMHALIGGLHAVIPMAILPIALGTSVVVGAVAGVLPARAAARLDPVHALRGE